MHLMNLQIHSSYKIHMHTKNLTLQIVIVAVKKIRVLIKQTIKIWMVSDLKNIKKKEEKRKKETSSLT